MDQAAEVYLQRAKEYEALATEAETELLKRTYFELARGYLALAQHAPQGKAKTGQVP